MKENSILVLTGEEIRSIFEGKEKKIIAEIGKASETHAKGDSTLPHSMFLKFPGQPKDRIIALPAYLGGESRSGGIKWISSFPDNIHQGIDRASAVMAINSMETGRVKAILEGSVISASRTAASAALAAAKMARGEVKNASLIGCGLINFEILKYLHSVFPGMNHLFLHDLDHERATYFRDKAAARYPNMEFTIVDELGDLLSRSSLISLATTVPTPYIHDIAACPANTLILNISLRDISAGIILDAVNVVDDVDHVCRAQTSIHLAEQEAGNRDFIHTTLGDLLIKSEALNVPPEQTIVFSPFGMGVLDIVLADLVCAEADKSDTGTYIPDFFPVSF